VILLALDVDGTLDCGNPPGPLPWAKVVEFLNMHPDVAVGIVSSSASRPKIGPNTQTGVGGPVAKIPMHEYLGKPETRAGNLQLFRKSYPEAALRFYVSDNVGDEANATAAGFTLIKPPDFAQGFLT
jgi:hypothetical protein